MRFVTLPDHNLLVADAVDPKTGKSAPVTCRRDSQGFEFTAELGQADFAKLLNGARVKLTVFGQVLPAIGIKIER